jgi:hypothetical protein
MVESDALLLTQEEVMDQLRLLSEDLNWLTATGQLSPIVIHGRRRFVAAEVRSLVKAYQTVQARGAK